MEGGGAEGGDGDRALFCLLPGSLRSLGCPVQGSSHLRRTPPLSGAGVCALPIAFRWPSMAACLPGPATQEYKTLTVLSGSMFALGVVVLLVGIAFLTSGQRAAQVRAALLGWFVRWKAVTRALFIAWPAVWAGCSGLGALAISLVCWSRCCAWLQGPGCCRGCAPC